MTRSYRATLLCALALVVPACDGGADVSNTPLESVEQKASYAIGRNIGTQMAPAAERLDVDAFLRGMQEAMAEQEAALPEEDLRASLQQFSQQIQEAQQAEMQVVADSNRAAGEAYMAENASKEGVTTTESGLQFQILQQGEGESPGPSDRVTVHYTGTLIDGTEFDSSVGGDPATFAVSGVIPGFSEGLQRMKEGGRYRLVIPGDLAYGDQERGEHIKPQSTLIFEIEMIEVHKQDQGGGEGG